MDERIKIASFCGLKECPVCENFRYIILNDESIACHKCNWNKRYPVKEQLIYSDCEEISPCKSDCPCGTYKSLVKQN